MMSNSHGEALITLQEVAFDDGHACIRVCPVRAIVSEVNWPGPRVVPERCIGCGSCITDCAPGRAVYRSDVHQVRQMLASGRKVAAMVGPSIAGEFEDIKDYRKFVQMIRELGFSFVHEVSFGVDLIALKYKQLLEDHKGKYYITANCPAVVSYIEKYHPDLLTNLAPIVSPMIATARVLREIYGDMVDLVYIGPCIAAKDEVTRYDDEPEIGAVLTYTELRELFSEFGIDERKLEFSDFDPPFGYKGSLYPIPNGLLQAAAISEDMLEGEVLTIHGGAEMIRAVNEFKGDTEDIGRHVNLFYCNGCMMGPGTSPGGNVMLRRTAVTRYAVKRLKDFDIRAWESYVLRFSKLNLAASFKADDQRLPDPPEEKVAEILKLIGREDPDSHGNCQGCGFHNCREFAVHVAHGLARTEMCTQYALRSRDEYIRSLRKNNERLQQVQREIISSGQTTKEDLVKAQQANERAQAILQRLHSAVVAVDASLKIIQSNQNFINLLGDEAHEINEIIPGLIGADLKTLLPHPFYNVFAYVLQNGDEFIQRDVHLDDKLLNVTVFTIRKHELVGAVIRDMYMPEVQKEEVIKRVTEVITENLGMVQKIGFLLGEGAARTERMLNSIIETYRSGQQK
ncbi:MAG TPA: [Fe-Fe] hydrogenase large subunit C-terminal domain-containing protein [Bacteroidales bacterium]|nr:[Fe-Fe] hydrogenase large subunit C-terminal domain-containing protein [Bacteroidales bacterium]